MCKKILPRCATHAGGQDTEIFLQVKGKSPTFQNIFMIIFHGILAPLTQKLYGLLFLPHIICAGVP